MAMNPGSRRGGQVSSINMTPMIDVLLVLLIIFMVVQQQLQRGLSVQVPPVSPAPDAAPEALVLEVAPGGVYRLNRQAIAPGALRGALAGVLSSRHRKVLFVRADERVAYGEVMGAVDASRDAGATVVGLIPR